MESHKDGHHFPWLSRLPTSTRRPFNLVVFTRAFLLAQTTKFEMRKKIVHLPGRMLHVQITKLDCRRVDVPPFCLSWEIMPAFVRFHCLFIEIERAQAWHTTRCKKVKSCLHGGLLQRYKEVATTAGEFASCCGYRLLLMNFCNTRLPFPSARHAATTTYYR